MGADRPDAATDDYGIPIIPDPDDTAVRKRQAIIDAALAEFLAEGYAAARIDTITARSGVSKATIYKHFGSKERLFLAVIGGLLPRTYADLEPTRTTIVQATDLREALIRLTTDWARILLRPDIMSLRRLVIGELDRFPQLGQLWYRVSYDMNNGPLVEAVTELDARGVLDVPNPKLAVQQLVAATLGVPQLVQTFSAEATVDDAELAEMIESGVDLFLARYGGPKAG
ncbi:TetR/AcrR family transcriptional regulator [Yinghuangia seranimata]|uniref:TetR/AcrR family transcriptional regulator n=1 Tax=Yinghuangia seranimata TaxID=408067 RepID=UPI00248CCD13|nr:TetR/AcrR family transcriptional regulator [Yinghuangia seranimata]MDI2124953.1 TetR/AcrR family transcriptional regulator [Yinghuangia seranimata]